MPLSVLLIIVGLLLWLLVPSVSTIGLILLIVGGVLFVATLPSLRR